MKDILHYACCVKFTRGQLDREPFSKYKTREAEVDLVPTHDDDNRPDGWLVSIHNKPIADGETIEQACSLAAYELMNKSRDDVLKSDPLSF